MKNSDSDLRGLESNQEIILGDDLPVEAPAKEFVPGPYYKNIEERVRSVNVKNSN